MPMLRGIHRCWDVIYSHPPGGFCYREKPFAMVKTPGINLGAGLRGC